MWHFLWWWVLSKDLYGETKYFLGYMGGCCWGDKKDLDSEEEAGEHEDDGEAVEAEEALAKEDPCGEIINQNLFNIEDNSKVFVCSIKIFATADPCQVNVGHEG